MSTKKLWFVLARWLLAPTADAYPLNPWNERIPDHTVAVMPMLYGYPGPSYTAIGYAGYGFGERFDVYLGQGIDFAEPDDGGVAVGTFEAIPRVFVTPELALVPHLFYTPGGTISPAPEIHLVKWAGSFSVTANLAWRPEIGTTAATAGFDPGSVVALIAPEVYLGDKFALFVEFDPSIPLSDPARMELVLAPGVWWALDREQNHSFALAVQMTVPSVDGIGSTLSPGVSYWTSFATR